jgi:hypothetical protein
MSFLKVNAWLQKKGLPNSRPFFILRVFTVGYDEVEVVGVPKAKAL